MDKSSHKGLVRIDWDDVPWLSEQAKQEILASTPAHLRATVSQGLPSIGEGTVYPIPLEDIVLRPEDTFKIPEYYRKLYGMDVGWNTTAAVFAAHDPDTDIIYIYGEYVGHHQTPDVHATSIKRIAGDWMRGVIDPAARTTSQADGKALLRTYRAPPNSLKLREADNAVEAGINEVWSRLLGGRLKFFPNTSVLQTELLIYRRKNGRIVKENDHCADSLRYVVMGIRHATPSPGASGMKALDTAGPAPKYREIAYDV